MADTLSLHLRLFGAFRNYGEKITVTVPYGSTIGALKQELAQRFPNEEALVAESVISNEMEVLADDYMLETNESLAILPPVCGG